MDAGAGGSGGGGVAAGGVGAGDATEPAADISRPSLLPEPESEWSRSRLGAGETGGDSGGGTAVRVGTLLAGASGGGGGGGGGCGWATGIMGRLAGDGGGRDTGDGAGRENGRGAAGAGRG